MTEKYTEHRPWGSFTVLEDADDCKVKRLVVKPGGVLSLQYHHHRSEYWVVISGEATVLVDNQVSIKKPGGIVYIPQGATHRLENQHHSQDVHIIEVQMGTYFGEDDIVRLGDIYGRTSND